jgi:methionyl-tRNA synthetase
MLLAAGYEVPKQLFVHGYLNIDNLKISKSLGNVIDPLDLVDLYGADAVRYSAARATSFGQDGNVTVESFHERYERELANDLGNLVSRTTAMIARYRGGQLAVTTPSPEIAEAVGRVAAEVPRRLDDWDLTGALDAIWELVRRLNRHVEQTKPWELARDEARAADLDVVLYDLVDGTRAAAVALYPYIPTTSQRILRALGQSEDVSWAEVASGRARSGSALEAAAPLFPRVDAPTAAA